MNPTAYPDVNAVLLGLRLSVEKVLGNHFVGMYLYGSLATGDFDPQTSDIDFLVVTADELPGELVSALEVMHVRIAANDSKWTKKLEGSYIPQDTLRRYDPTQARHPSIGVDWSFGVGHHGSDWIIQRYIIREQGVVLAGPSPRTLIDPILPNELRRAVLGTLREWWSQILHDPGQIRSSEYQAYAILTMCRALYTLHHGTIVTKPMAARWVQERLDGGWISLVQRAVSWKSDVQMDCLSETLDFIRYTLAQSQQFEAELVR